MGAMAAIACLIDSPLGLYINDCVAKCNAVQRFLSRAASAAQAATCAALRRAVLRSTADRGHREMTWRKMAHVQLNMRRESPVVLAE